MSSPHNAGEQTPLLGSTPTDPTVHHDQWEFAGWGSVANLQVPEARKRRVRTLSMPPVTTAPTAAINAVPEEHPDDPAASLGGDDEKPHVKLDEYRATAISGNDISSSVLYVVGRCFVFAGRLAPFSLSAVILLLYLFRNIYTEVVTALPLNGGAFNALLNTTTKLLAAMAGGLTLLSYAATAVVSANSAASYLNALSSDLNVYLFTIIILAIFCCVTLLGMTESANVAITMFIFHLLTLVMLAIACMIYVFSVPEILQTNWLYSSPIKNPFEDFYFGFCAALLGVSGFESSANFIEEQAPGVFAKTLTYMWAVVAIVNPLMGLLAMSVLPMGAILQDSNSLLAQMGAVSAGRWLMAWVTVDATIVLCGAVLTGYVGVTGLANRMTLDRCLPQFFLSRNPWRGTLHWIIIGFFLLTTSLFVIVNGNVSILDGVYAIAFLCVMALFSIGNMVLKYKRNRLPRETRASWWTVIIAFFAVIAGAVGTIISDIDNLIYFLIYFAVTAALILSMLQRGFLLKLCLYFISSSFLRRYFSNWIKDQLHELKQISCIFFAKTGDVSVINKAILYVRDNELTSKIRIVHLYSDASLRSTSDIDGLPDPAKPYPLNAFPHAMDPAQPLLDEDSDASSFASSSVPCIETGDLPLSAKTPTIDSDSDLSLNESTSDDDDADLDLDNPLDQALAAQLDIPVKAVAPSPKLISTKKFDPTAAAVDPVKMREQLVKDVLFLDRMYPKIRIDLVLVNGEFNPRSIKYISEQLGVPPNFMFLTAPGDRFPYNLGDLHGVRLITH